MKKTLCYVLTALMIWTPFQIAHAGMIGTVDAAAAQADRGTVSSFVSRADVVRQLGALGIDPATAQERVAALSDQEVKSLADRIHGLPAGADAGGIALLVVIVIVIWWFWRR